MAFTESAELLALAGAVFAALAQLASKQAVSLSSPAMYLAIRWSASLAMLSVVVTAAGGWSAFRLSSELIYVLAGTLIGPVLAWNLYTRALTRLDVAVAYPLTQTATLGSLALAMAFLGETPNLFAALGALLIVAGIFLLYGRPGSSRAKRISASGTFLALATAACWSLTYVFWKLSVVHFTVLQANWTRAAVPAILMPLALVWSSGRAKDGRTPLKVGQAAAWYAILAGLSADVLSFGLQFMALSAGRVATVVPIIGSSPLFVVGLSVLLLGERVTRWALLGILAIVSGVWLVAGPGSG